jgi:AbrB family looped-hinge helix DNA binding protein
MSAAIVNSRFGAVRTTIDGTGRLVIPKAIRDRLGLHGNEQVEITERDGRIEIEPTSTGVELTVASSTVSPSGTSPVAQPTTRWSD